MAQIEGNIFSIDNVVYEDNSPQYVEPCVFVGNTKRYLLYDQMNERYEEWYGDGLHDVELQEGLFDK